MAEAMTREDVEESLKRLESEVEKLATDAEAWKFKATTAEREVVALKANVLALETEVEKQEREFAQAVLTIEDLRRKGENGG